ncbi:dephospho-CoA kinase [bacterium]|nr:dephospho-CoA kinase [bacterium]
MTPTESHPSVIGLLGGVAAGKSTVAGMFAELGATVIDADAIAHAVLDRPETRERIVARWGADVIGEDGKVDREALGHRIFIDAQDVAALEAMTHPAIVAATRQQVLDARGSDDAVAVVVNAPLLLEAELDDLCDLLVFIDCPTSVRLARVRERGWDEGELERRESHQHPLQTKREVAHRILDGSAPPETTFQQVQQLWQETLGL